MSEHSTAGAAHGHPTTKLFIIVWVGLVAITLIEVFLAYVHIFGPGAMLALLLALSVAKAGMIMSYFMHLRYEKLTLTMWLIPATVICITLMAIFFPDAMRAFELRPK